MSTVDNQACASPDNLASQGAVRESSYGQILKSSAFIGGSSVMRILFGIVRTKVMATLLGPAGVGLIGVFTSITDLAQAVAGMGLSSSGVRQVAERAAKGDETGLQRTIAALRAAGLWLGILGAVSLALLAGPLATFSFGDGGRASAIAWLGAVVLFGVLSNAQSALVQGMRRVQDLAALTVIGSAFGTVSAVIVVYAFARAGKVEQGIVPSLVAVALSGLGASWWYSRRVGGERIRIPFKQMREEFSGLFKLGFVFMASGLMVLGVGYFVRIIVIRELGEDAAGYYQASWTLGGLYVGFILQAMGADFFPRLTSVAHDNRECNRLVNEQAEVSLLMAGPGVLGTLTFAPLVISLFYSAKFGPAVEVLRWICLGMALRVASWPMSFILLAKGARQPFFWSELVTSVVQVGFVWVLVKQFGLNGTGAAFAASYLFYWVLIWLLVRWLSGFRWSSANRRLGGMLVLSIGAVFLAGFSRLPGWAFIVLGGTLTAITTFLSLRRILRLLPPARLPKWLLLISRFANFGKP